MCAHRSVADGTGTRLIDSGDPTDLRNWLNTYERTSWARTRRARIYMKYDAYNTGSGQYGKGKRTAMWDACGYQSLWYDEAGRVWKEERAIDGQTYETQWTFDAMDRVYELTYHDSEKLTHSYASNGLLSQIVSSLSSTLLSGALYNALNSPTQYALGSDPTALASHTYYGPDATGYPYGALKTIRLQQGTNPMLVDRDIAYDPVGNLMRISDLANSENISYSYDYLDRLTGASAPSGESYAYNEIGNITSKNDPPISYGYGDFKHIHAGRTFFGRARA